MSDKARLPEPPRKMSTHDLAVLRGNADSMALRLACHDAAIHRKLAPEAQGCACVYDAVEQARGRIESARAGLPQGRRRQSRMAMARGPLPSAACKYEDITDRGRCADRGCARSDGAVKRPHRARTAKAAQKIVDLWAFPISEERAGENLDALCAAISEDQNRFARSVRELLTSLDMGRVSAARERGG